MDPKKNRPKDMRANAVEQTIREAQEAGEFDDLEGSGRPLRDLGEPYDEMWWIKSKLRDEGFSVLPEALAVKRDVECALEDIAKVRSEAEVRRRLEALNQRIRKVNTTTRSGPSSSLAPIDVDAAVERWRGTRG